MLPLAHGTDVSRYETPINFDLNQIRGLKFAAIRCTVGDYYTDPQFRNSWNEYKKRGFLVTGYLVTAPRDNTLMRRISSHQHLDRFFNSVIGLKPDIPWIMDSELTRGERNDYVTQLNHEVALGLSNDLQGNMPIIYTRQSWWDYYINAIPLWSQCDLWAARYSLTLTSPWSDGHYIFRDWKTWKFWQYTDKGDGIFYGFTGDGDMDYFNGDVGDLYEYAKLPRPLTIEDQVKILMREAKLHNWNTNP